MQVGTERRLTGLWCNSLLVHFKRCIVWTPYCSAVRELDNLDGNFNGPTMLTLSSVAETFGCVRPVSHWIHHELQVRVKSATHFPLT